MKGTAMKRRLGLLAAVLLASTFFYAGTEAHDAHTVSPRKHTDVNNDDSVNVIDLNQTSTCRNTDPCTGTNLQDVDHSYNGAKEVIDLQIVSACFTATVDSTPCANYTYRDLIFDRQGLHDGCISVEDDGGAYEGGPYDWAYGARPGGAPEGNKLTPWYQVTIDHCITGSYDSTPDIPSGLVSLTDFRSYAWNGSAWSSLGSGLDLDQWGDRPLGFDSHNCDGEWDGTAITDGIEFTPGTDPVCIAHGWVYPRVTPPSGYVCALVVLTVDAPAGFLVNVGMDDYNTETYIKDIGIGRFRSDGKVGWSSCSGTILRTNSPPI